MQEYGTDNDWDHADFGPGFDWDASWGEQNMGGDINIDQGMAWQFAQWLTQADQIWGAPRNPTTNLFVLIERCVLLGLLQPRKESNGISARL